MTLGQFILFLIGLAGTIYFVRLWVVELGFPRSLIEATKPYSCEFCGKKYWSARKSFNCCKGTPGYEARAREIARKAANERSKQKPHSPVGMPVEHDCPRCHGKPGDYMCPMCEGRGKTFIW